MTTHASLGFFSWFQKAETQSHLINFIAKVEKQFEKQVKIIRTDNGAEFSMHNFFTSKRIIHQTICIETPNKTVLSNESINTF